MSLPPSERKTSARAGGGGGRSRRRRRVREGDVRAARIAAAARGGSTRRHVMSASARTDQCALSHASACIVAPAKPTSATSNVSEACRRANSARMAYAIANGQTSRRSRHGTRAYRRTSRTPPPSASLADADAIADVEWSRGGSTTPRTSDDGLSRALHSSDDDEHFGKARFVHPTSTSLLHLARIRGGFDSSNFRVSGRAFRFRSAFLSCGYLLWSGLGSRRPRPNLREVSHDSLVRKSAVEKFR